MEAVSIWAVVLAAITMISNIADKIIKRGEVKDKLTNDVKVAVLEQNHAKCEETTARVEKELEVCKKAHEDSERDRQDMRREIGEIKIVLSGKTKPAAGGKHPRPAEADEPKKQD